MSDLLDRIRDALTDRYAVESEIGRGGMATVFLAEDLKHLDTFYKEGGESWLGCV